MVFLNRWQFLLVFSAAVSLTASSTLAAKEPAAAATAKTQYMRTLRDEKERPTALETAIVSFVPIDPKAAPLTVDLVGAVHIADKSYYADLNHRFKDYDAVLYELVAPEGTRIPKGGRKEKSSNPLSAMQLGMKDMLHLQFQLDEVDYTPKNFVHADLSPEGFSKSMHDRDEGISDIFARMIGYAIAKQAQGDGKGSEIDLLVALFQKDRSMALKRAMAEQFEEMEGAMVVFEGPKGGTLIGERNKRALQVLKKQIASGKKKIAIFYGAGHMNDMEKRLREDFALQPRKTTWLQAWDMK